MDFDIALAGLAPLLGGDGVGDVRRLSGGATQEIWRFELLHDGGREPLVLRRARPGGGIAAGGIGIGTEAALLIAATAAGVPVPRVRYVLTPKDHLGDGFVMAFVAGETLGGRIVRQEAASPVGLARQCGAALARIHAIRLDALPPLERLTPAELLDAWRASFRATGQSRPVFEAALRVLAARCPPPGTVGLVHGDFRNGNLMVGADGLRAVLDWELAHVGDRHEDLGWICVPSWRFGSLGLPVGGFGTVDDLVAGYEGAGGALVDRAALGWWQMFGTLRWGIMCAGMAAAFRGTDPSVERAMIARRTSETEIDLLPLLAA